MGIGAKFILGGMKWIAIPLTLLLVAGRIFGSLALAWWWCLSPLVAVPVAAIGLVLVYCWISAWLDVRENKRRAANRRKQR